jgi:unsaturated rhamnogalacturonyl hydrolase
MQAGRKVSAGPILFAMMMCLSCTKPGTAPDAGGADVGSGSSGGSTTTGTGDAASGATGGAPTGGSVPIASGGAGGASVSAGSGGSVGSTGGSVAVSTGGVGSGGGVASGGNTTVASGGRGGGPGGNVGGIGGRGATGGPAMGGRGGGPGGGLAGAGGLPSRAAVVGAMTTANNYFMNKWPDPGVAIVTDKTRPSHIWTRAVYYEGLMGLYSVDAQKRYYDYAVQWGTSHAWGLNNGTTTTSADDQCAGQTYLDLYKIDQQAERLRDIKTNIDRTVASSSVSDWSWVDAIQMAMPVYARMGVITGSATYFDKMYAYYGYTKKTTGTSGLFNKTEHLWWRDADFDPPYTEPNGDDCYWSRGNGWAYAALTRVLDIIPSTETHRAEYLADFVAMSDALRAVQRSDGFWNASLQDPTHFAGKELTGTALFTYGMAWGIRQGILSDAVYRPIVIKAWNAMVADSLHTNGFLGWVQGTGKQPSDGQPVTADKVPDFEDYGLGCFLLAGSEVAKLSP